MLASVASILTHYSRFMWALDHQVTELISSNSIIFQNDWNFHAQSKARQSLRTAPYANQRTARTMCRRGTVA